MGQSPPSEECNIVGVGSPFLQGNAEFGERHPIAKLFHPNPRKRCRVGDILISVRAPVGALNVADQEYGIGRGLCAITPRMDLLERDFAWYFLDSGRSQLDAISTGSTYDAVSTDQVAGVLCPVPSLSEQRAIASFLDRETVRVDALVAKKERLIELLEDKRAALITQAVTRGLGPSVSMKDSGIAAIGQVPAHWEVKRLKHLTPDDRPIMYGIVLPGPNVVDGVPIVKGGDVSPGRLRLDLLNKTTREIESAYERSRLKAGDIVYAIRGSIGMAEIVPSEIEGANLTQDAARVAPARGVHSKWLLFALNSRAVFAQLDAGAAGAAIRGINIRDLKRAVIPVPPPNEQIAIADWVAMQTAELDVLARKVRQATDRLGEYRTALISAAVTGKIEVGLASV
jgi:type I restriction enzyme S subunit